jgi:hypothetical protein
MSADEEGRQRLAMHMNRCRLALGLMWKELADISRVSEATLRRLCEPKDFHRTINDLTKARIERGLRWRVGAVDRILAEPDYQPDGRPLGRDASVEDIVRYLDDLLAVAPDDFQQVMHRLDIKWARQVSVEPPAAAAETSPSAT